MEHYIRQRNIQESFVIDTAKPGNPSSETLPQSLRSLNNPREIYFIFLLRFNQYLLKMWYRVYITDTFCSPILLSNPSFSVSGTKSGLFHSRLSYSSKTRF